MTRIYALILTAMLLSAAPGCSTIFSNLPSVLAYVQDGQLVLSTIESFANAFFAARPDASAQKAVNEAIAKAKSALDLAVRAAEGVDGLKQADVDAAFKSFSLAYQDLISLLGPMGVHVQGSKLQATPGGLLVPEPLCFRLK
jgi:hypothetical protein